MSKLTIAQIKTAVIVGDLDANLADIKQAIKTREGMIAGELLQSLSPKDVVYFNDKVRPTYMKGLKATVIKVNRTRVQVKLDQPVGRFSGIIGVPISLLTTSL